VSLDNICVSPEARQRANRANLASRSLLFPFKLALQDIAELPGRLPVSRMK
jgi:hypothetical protein